MKTMQELVARKVELQAYLLGYAMWNTYDKSPEELGEQMIRNIEHRRELFSIERDISNYIEGVDS